MNVALIIAGGSGTRMHQDIPKQFLTVNEKPVIVYTLEAFQNHAEIDQIAVVVVNAINLGIVVVVGQCIGANDYEQAKYYIKKLMKISYIVTGIIGSAVILLLPWILNLYSLSSEARNLTFILVIMHNIMATALHPTAFVLPNGLRAAGDVKFSMVVGIVSMILFRLGAAVLFGIIFNLGIIGVWIAMGSDWLCRSVCFVIRFIKGKWRQFKVI